MLKKRDLWILCGALALAAALFAVAKVDDAPSRIVLPSGQSNATVVVDERVELLGGGAEWRYQSDAPDAPARSLADAGVPEADSYAVVWLGERFHIIPLVESLEGATLTVREAELQAENVVELGRDRFDMRSANCPDGLCLTEGEVTPENREGRALRSMIICLPHKLVIEMFDPGELLQLLQRAAPTR